MDTVRGDTVNDHCLFSIIQFKVFNPFKNITSGAILMELQQEFFTLSKGPPIKSLTEVQKNQVSLKSSLHIFG